MKDICCIGHITKDKIVTPEQTQYMSGGTSFYFARALNSLPHRIDTMLVTKMGREDMAAVDDLRQRGIELKAYESAHTVYFENKYGENRDNRTQRVLAKADPFTINELEPYEAKVYHLGALLADDFSPELVEFLAQRGRISIDAQGYLREVRGEQVYPIDWADKRRILSHTAVLKVNEYEMEVVTGLTDPRDAAQRLADWGVEEAVVTLGSHGSLILANGEYHVIPAYKPREVVDATGCGDTYSAGYLYCRCQGKSIDEAGRYAAAMCTLKLEHIGPIDSTEEQVLEIIRRG